MEGEVETSDRCINTLHGAYAIADVVDTEPAECLEPVPLVCSVLRPALSDRGVLPDA